MQVHLSIPGLLPYVPPGIIRDFILSFLRMMKLSIGVKMRINLKVTGRNSGGDFKLMENKE